MRRRVFWAQRLGRAIRDVFGVALVRNFAYLGAAEVAIRVASVLSFVIVSRTVGPENLGHLTFALALVAYASVLGDGGLTVYMQRQIAGGQVSVNPAVTATTVVQLALAFSVGVLVIVFAMVLPIQGQVSLLVIAQAPLLIAQALSLSYVLQARELMRSVALVRVATQGSVIVMTIALVVATGNILWAAIAYWVGLLVGDGLCAWLVWSRGLYRPVSFEPRMLLELARKGVPFLGIAFATQLFANMDVVLLGLLRSPREVGEYGSALRLVQFGLSMMAIVSTATFPQLSRRFVADRPAFDALLHRLVAVTARASLAVTALVLVEAHALVLLMFGDKFAASGGILVVLITWIPLGFFGTVVGTALLAGGHQRAYLGAIVAAAVVFVGLLALLVPILGGPGAAAAVIGREAVVLVLFSAVAARYLHQHPILTFVRQLPYLAGPLAACLLLGSALGETPLWVMGPAWAVSVLVIEAVLGWPTLRLSGRRA